jgi:hypothetical protein
MKEPHKGPVFHRGTKGGQKIQRKDLLDNCLIPIIIELVRICGPDVLYLW